MLLGFKMSAFNLSGMEPQRDFGAEPQLGFLGRSSNWVFWGGDLSKIYLLFLARANSFWRQEIDKKYFDFEKEKYPSYSILVK